MAVTAERKRTQQSYYSRRWPRTDDAQARIWNQQTCGSNHTGPGLTGGARQQDPIGQAGAGCEGKKSKCGRLFSRSSRERAPLRGAAGWSAEERERGGGLQRVMVMVADG